MADLVTICSQCGLAYREDLLPHECAEWTKGTYETSAQRQIKDTRQRWEQLVKQGQEQDAYCEECKGITHMPWCSEYEEPVNYSGPARCWRHGKTDCGLCPRSSPQYEPFPEHEPPAPVAQETEDPLLTREEAADRRIDRIESAQNLVKGPDGFPCYCKCHVTMTIRKQSCEHCNSYERYPPPSAEQRLEAQTEVMAKVVHERNGLREQNERLREALRELIPMQGCINCQEGFTYCDRHGNINETLKKAYAALNHAARGEGK